MKNHLLRLTYQETLPPPSFLPWAMLGEICDKLCSPWNQGFVSLPWEGLALRDPPPARVSSSHNSKGRHSALPLASSGAQQAAGGSYLSWKQRCMLGEGSLGHLLGGWQGKDIHRIPSLQRASDIRLDAKD